MSSNNDYYYQENSTYKEIKPDILTEYNKEMFSIKKLVYVEQTPPDGYAYIPWYISAGPQIHFAIYKIKNNDELELLYQNLLIVYDGCSAYIIDKNIKEALRQNGLKYNEIELLMKNKYNYVTHNLNKN
jgi:hypothetical protein